VALQTLKPHDFVLPASALGVAQEVPPLRTPRPAPDSGRRTPLASASDKTRLNGVVGIDFDFD
jgi:hypothetical protein